MKGDGVAVGYPVPQAWRRPNYVRALLLVLSFFAFGVFLVWYGLGGITSDQWVRVLFGVLGGFGIVGLGAVVLRTALPGGLSGSRFDSPVPPDESGLHLVLPRIWAIIEILANVTISVSGVIFAAGVWCDLFHPDLTPGQRLFLPFAVAISAVVVCRSTYFRMTRLSRGMVVLSPSGITIADYFRVRSLSWSEIDCVSPTGGKSRKDSRLAIALNRRQGPPLTVHVDELAIGAPAAFWLIDFYWRNPEVRWELSTERSVERLRDGSIVEEADRFVGSDS